MSASAKKAHVAMPILGPYTFLAMSISIMSDVDFKKWQYCPVRFEDQVQFSLPKYNESLFHTE